MRKFKVIWNINKMARSENSNIFKILLEACLWVSLLVLYMADGPTWQMILISYSLGRMNLLLEWVKDMIRWLCCLVMYLVCGMFGRWLSPNTCLEDPTVEQGAMRGENINGGGGGHPSPMSNAGRGRKRNRGRRR